MLTEYYFIEKLYFFRPTSSRGTAIPYWLACVLYTAWNARAAICDEVSRFEYYAALHRDNTTRPTGIECGKINGSDTRRPLLQQYCGSLWQNECSNSHQNVVRLNFLHFVLLFWVIAVWRSTETERERTRKRTDSELGKSIGIVHYTNTKQCGTHEGLECGVVAMRVMLSPTRATSSRS